MGFHEKLRLLYVACTRARDHLVVSVHRTDREPADDRTQLDRTPSCCGTRPRARDCRRGRPAAAPTVAPRAARRAAAPAPLALDDVASREHARRVRERARAARFVSATALARAAADAAAADDPGLAKDGRDLELPPWNKGRYGTAIGRAVHAVLQTVDLATGAGLDDRRGRAGRGRRRARPRGDDRRRSRESRSTSATVREAVAPRVLARDVRRGARSTGLTLEGYVDLVYRDDPTASSSSTTRPTRSPTTPTLARRLAHYRLQGAAYALAVAAATGEAVERVRVRVPAIPPARPRSVIEGADLDGRSPRSGRWFEAERGRRPTPSAPGGVRRTLNARGSSVPSWWDP